MRSTKSKNQNTQLPDQVEAVNQFHAILEAFFDGNDAEGQIETLTELCLAYTGNTPDHAEIDRYSIANMVFSADKICQFLRDVDFQYLYGSPLSEIETKLLDGYLGSSGTLDLTQLIQDALHDWIASYDIERSIEYLQLAIAKFQTISDLIKVCNKIHLSYVNGLTKEGGASC